LMTMSVSTLTLGMGSCFHPWPFWPAALASMGR
jgi:hypothetical protein